MACQQILPHLFHCMATSTRSLYAAAAKAAGEQGPARLSCTATCCLCYATPQWSPAGVASRRAGGSQAQPPPEGPAIMCTAKGHVALGWLEQVLLVLVSSCALALLASLRQQRNTWVAHMATWPQQHLYRSAHLSPAQPLTAISICEVHICWLLRWRHGTQLSPHTHMPLPLQVRSCSPSTSALYPAALLARPLPCCSAAHLLL
jgi:hypothetical protein